MSAIESRPGWETRAANETGNSGDTRILQADKPPALKAALTFLAQGISVVPARSDGSKAPAGPWKEYQERRAAEQELYAWFGGERPQYTAIGVVTGPVSGNLELAEIEGRAAHEMHALQELAYNTGLKGLWDRLCNGWLERSPSGGYHFFYRLQQPPAGNTKLASRPATAEELAANPREKTMVLAETRGTGGYVVTAPSGGQAHPTGRAWTLVAGGPTNIPTLIGEEQEQFHTLLRTLHQPAVTGPAASRPAQPSPFAASVSQPQQAAAGEVSPLDDFEARTDWADILLPAGWRQLHADAAGVRYWTRPGKTTGISATTGKDPARDRLFVFSSSTEFQQETPYTKQGAHALIHHGGDHSAAASQLRKDGYGSPRPAPAPAAAAKSKPAAPGKPGEVSLDDSPLAQWTADKIRDRTCWAGGLGWMFYKAGVWKPATEATAVELVRKEFRSLYQEEIEAGAGVDRLRKLASLLTAGKIRAVTGLLKGILEADAAAFDLHPELLNVGNGVVDLSSSELLPHSPAYLFTRITPTRYNPDARHADWDKALQALPAASQPWMQIRFGQAATGHPVPDDIMPVLHGSGENGKSTVVSAVTAALGDHAVYVPERVLLSNPSDHPTELTTLQGARLALIEETPEARHLNVKRLKDTVGTPTMTARRIRQDSITWHATHSLFLTSNYRPRVDETDHGTWRRLALVSFPYTYLKPGITPSEPHHRAGDQGLRDRFRTSPAHKEAVLAWIVAGARKWYDAGRVMPPMPEQVQAETDAWRSESDAVWSYVRDHLEFDADSAILSPELLESFNRWLKSQGHREWSARTLADRMDAQPALRKHAVVKRRVTNPTNLSRLHPIDLPAKTGKETVWAGLRFSR